MVCPASLIGVGSRTRLSRSYRRLIVLKGRDFVIRSVVFDVGETLLDDTREFNAWADWISVPRHTFSALIGIVVAQGRNNAEAFQYVRPGFDLATERKRR